MSCRRLAITVPGAAAGKTEWNRGAYAVLRSAVENDIANACVAHAPALPWWRTRLQNERETLYEWISLLPRVSGTSQAAGNDSALLADALDAYLSLDVPVEAFLSPELSDIVERGARRIPDGF